MTMRRTLAIGIASTALVLTGCSVPEAVVGVRDVPTSTPSGAPLDSTTAGVITARVLTDAARARATGGKAGENARKAVLTGPALTLANAAVKTKTAPAPPDSSVRPPVPQVVALSAERGWPRYILATTLDTTQNRRFLHVLVSAKASAPFRLHDTIAMTGGATLPKFKPAESGVEIVSSGKGLVLAPGKAISAYGKSIGYPKRVSNKAISAKDAATTNIVANAKKQQKSLGKLAKLTQTHTAAKEAPIAFRTANGGALVFGLLNRTDSVKLAATAKELRLPSDVASQLGKSKVKKSIKVSTLEPVVMSVPVKGQASILGLDEQIASVSGS